MNNNRNSINFILKKTLLGCALLVVFTYFFSLFSISMTYFFVGGFYLVQKSLFSMNSLLWLIMVGLSFSLLSALLSWPFALSLVTLIKQNEERLSIIYLQQIVRFLASLPLVVFLYLFLQVKSFQVFYFFEDTWSQVFSATSWLTQFLAFTITLLLYPLTIIPSVSSDMSVDVFYQKTVTAVIESSEVGLVSSVVVFGLFVFILPQMTMVMLKSLRRDQNLQNIEVVQAMGGTEWESVYMTVLQSMREHFNLIVLRFTRVCFFEGLLTLSLLSFFVKAKEPFSSWWGATLSSLYVHKLFMEPLQPRLLLVLSAAMVSFYLLIRYFEHLAQKIKEGD